MKKLLSICFVTGQMTIFRIYLSCHLDTKLVSLCKAFQKKLVRQDQTESLGLGCFRNGRNGFIASTQIRYMYV